MGARESLASDLGASLEGRAFFHAERLGLDVTNEVRLLLQLATVGGDGALDLAVELHFTCFNVSFDAGVLCDGHLSFFGDDFTIDLTVDDHIV